MKKIAVLFAAFTIVLAGCSSTEEPTSAPITTSKPAAGGTPGGTGPSTGGLAKPPTVVPGPVTGGAGGPGSAGLLGQRSVYFEFDSNDINEKYRPMLQAHAGWLTKNNIARLAVQGNTDERGSREYNLALGQRRADSVKRMLVLMGAREGQIETVSFGEEKPKRPGNSEGDYAENRRGDLVYAGE